MAAFFERTYPLTFTEADGGEGDGGGRKRVRVLLATAHLSNPDEALMACNGCADVPCLYIVRGKRLFEFCSHRELGPALAGFSLLVVLSCQSQSLQGLFPMPSANHIPSIL